MVRYVFNAADTGGRNHLWSTDGTAGGTAKLSDVDTDYIGGTRYPSQFATTYASLGNGYAVFLATDAAAGTELWVTDGTAAGTARVNDILPGSASSTPSGFTSLGNGRAVFAATDGATGMELWVTDGTPTGAHRIKDINGGAGGSSPYGFASLGGGTVLFAATDGVAGTELWATDGTAGGTRLVRDINPGTDANGVPNSSLPTGITPLGDGRVLFSATDGSTGKELWVSDGTAGGTRLVKDINQGYEYYSVGNSNPGGFVPLGDGRAVFSAYDVATGSEPWITDGTADGTRRVKDVHPGVQTYGPNSSLPTGFTPLGNGRFVFAASDGVTGQELWVSDGTSAGTSLLKDINPGVGNTIPDIPNSSNPGSFFALGGGKVLFSAFAPDTGGELWVTDGTPGGTRLVKDIYPSSYLGSTGPFPYSSSPGSFVGIDGGRALFSAYTAVTGQELWVTDGTEAGTSLLRDLNPGAGNSSPNAFTALQYVRGATGPDPLFDPVFYTTRNPDVAASGVDPYQHYLLNGYREGRDPDPFFSTQYYLTQNPDVADAASRGLNPLLHYEQYGYREGRNPSAQFDMRQYLAVNQDVAAAGLDPLRHYLADGRVEGRVAYAVPGTIPAPLVDAAYDLAANPDVRASGIGATEHYVTWGWHEGRNPDAFFDTGYYLSRNPDVAASGLNPLEHYDRYGWKEGRDASAQFSTGKYLAAYSDVRQAGVDPLQHFLQFGQGEGRQAFAV